MTLCLSLGIKKATATVIAQPALVLTPVFSFWTFGPCTSGGCCPYRKTEPKLCLSFRLTWVNCILTLGGSYGLMAIFQYLISPRVDWYTRDFNVVFVFVASPLYALATLCQLLIQFLDKCLCCGCRCFKDNCLPLTEKIVYDTENPL